MGFFDDHSQIAAVISGGIFAFVCIFGGFPMRWAWTIFVLGVAVALAVLLMLPGSQSTSTTVTAWMTAPFVLFVIGCAVNRQPLWLTLGAAVVTGVLVAAGLVVATRISPTEPMLLLFPASAVVLAGLLTWLCRPKTARAVDPGVRPSP